MTSPQSADGRDPTDFAPLSDGVPPLDRPSDAAVPHSAAVDTALDSIHARFENLDQQDKKAELLKSIEALGKLPHPRDAFVKVISMTLLSKTTPKMRQQIILQEMINFFMESTFDVSNQSLASRPRDWINIEFLKKIYKVILAYHAYFKELIASSSEAETWYTESLSILKKEGVKAFESYKPSDDEPLWLAKHHSERLIWLEELHGAAPIPDYKSQHEKAVAVIADILSRNMKRSFWEHNPFHTKPSHDEIVELAQQWNITLPTEEEFLERKVRDTVDRIENTLSVWEAEQAKKNIVYHLEGSDRDVKPRIALLEEAALKFPNLHCDKIPSFQARLASIVRTNILFNLEKERVQFEEELRSGKIQRIEHAAQTFFNFLRLETTPETLAGPSLDAIRSTVESFQREQETRMDRLLAAIALDRSKAVADSSEFQELGARGELLKKVQTIVER